MFITRDEKTPDDEEPLLQQYNCTELAPESVNITNEQDLGRVNITNEQDLGRVNITNEQDLGRVNITNEQDLGRVNLTNEQDTERVFQMCGLKV